MGNPDDLYSQILTNGPSAKTLFLLLSKLKREGQFRRVIQESLKALNVYPKDIYIRRLLAEAYFEVGAISQAETELEKVATLIGDLVSAYKLQAEMYSKQGREDEALEALNLYLAHRPNDQDALHLLDTLKPEEETPVTEPQLQNAEVGEVESSIAEEKGLSEMSSPTLAEIYFNQGQIKEAISTYEMLMAQNPEDEQSRKRLIELKAMMEQDALVERREADKAIAKKMITILEGWLANIQELFKTSLTAT